MIQEYEHFTDEGGRATALISFWGNLNQKQQKRKPANLGWALQENINKINYNYSFNRQNQNSNSNFQKFNSSKKIQKVPFNQIQNEIQTRRNQNQLKFGKNKTIGNKKPSRIDENQVKYHESIDQKCTNNQDVQCKENKEQKVESQDSSCNVQKLVSMFENKSVVDRTYSEPTTSASHQARIAPSGFVRRVFVFERVSWHLTLGWNAKRTERFSPGCRPGRER
eukprot:TRINITY_DN19323_c1_g1_i1.p1 TRINITY_DN19323_c1_g1~~TRINITY_DN19323_c1_g1_i1.p1  ORF type:complete len:223 (-),score=20.77 TRINITY_DN19323_c1_g1_i1:46-714(-)